MTLLGGWGGWSGGRQPSAGEERFPEPCWEPCLA